MLVDAALDVSAPLVALGAAAGIDRGYANAIDRAFVTVGKVGVQILEIPYQILTKGGIFLDNQFLMYGLATLGDVTSNMARGPGRTLTTLVFAYLVAKGLAKLSSYYRRLWAVRPEAVLRSSPR